MTEQQQPHDSVTIRAYDPHGFNVLITLRNGETMGRSIKALSWLRDNGFTPTPPKSSPNGNAASDVPTCPIHHKPMKPSKHGEGWYCPRKYTSGEFCKETA